MPFTLAHPAAVLPFRQMFIHTPHAFSALVIGSMTPDLPYFLAFLPRGEMTHTVTGLFSTCLPLALCVWILWITLLQRPTIASLPSALAKRCAIPSQQAIRASDGLMILIALLIGAASHILLDSFTHRTGFVVQMFPVFEQQIFAWHGYTLTIYRLLQHGGGILGMFILMRVFYKSPVNPSVQTYRALYFYAALGLILITTGLYFSQLWGTMLTEKALFLAAVLGIRLLMGIIIVHAILRVCFKTHSTSQE